MTVQLRDVVSLIAECRTHKHPFLCLPNIAGRMAYMCRITPLAFCTYLITVSVFDHPPLTMIWGKLAP